MERNINSTAMVKKEEEIELELGLSLSIGGSYNRKPNNNTTNVNGKNGISCVRSRVSCSLIGPQSSNEIMQEVDPKRKREILALRRQEAKKKREEKQLKKAGSFKTTTYLNSSTTSPQLNNNAGRVINNVNDNNGITWLKDKEEEFQAGMRSDANCEEQEPECKKIKREGVGSECNDVEKVNLNLGIDHQNEANGNSTSFFRPVPLRYGLPADGFVYPCGNVLPCWFPGGGAEERNVVRVPVVSYGFVPFNAGGSDPGHNLGKGNGYDSEEHNGSLDGGVNRKSGSNRPSPFCTSSTGSDRRSSSHEGGGSSYTRSHSSPSVPEQSQLNGSKANETNGQSEHSATSHLTESAPVNESNRDQSSPTEPKEEAKSETIPDPNEKRLSTPENLTSIPLIESKGDMGKPPQQNNLTPSLPYMPCVSTTGNGPNGKTINGFLHRYTKTEVSIICVCHGSSFSPAEFVQHAGGTDVSHPLRHITVIPSAF